MAAVNKKTWCGSCHGNIFAWVGRSGGTGRIFLSTQPLISSSSQFYFCDRKRASGKGPMASKAHHAAPTRSQVCPQHPLATISRSSVPKTALISRTMSSRKNGEKRWLTNTPHSDERWPIWYPGTEKIIYTKMRTTDLFVLGPDWNLN